MGTECTRPQTKAVMVLGCDDDRLHSSPFGNSRPLTGVQIAWIKHGWIFISMPPFFIRKSIRSEMDKHVVFHLLPIYLLGAGHRVIVHRQYSLVGYKLV